MKIPFEWLSSFFSPHIPAWAMVNRFEFSTWKNRWKFPYGKTVAFEDFNWTLIFCLMGKSIIICRRLVCLHLRAHDVYSWYKFSTEQSYMYLLKPFSSPNVLIFELLWYNHQHWIEECNREKLAKKKLEKQANSGKFEVKFLNEEFWQVVEKSTIYEKQVSTLLMSTVKLTIIYNKKLQPEIIKRLLQTARNSFQIGISFKLIQLTVERCLKFAFFPVNNNFSRRLFWAKKMKFHRIFVATSIEK